MDATIRPGIPTDWPLVLDSIVSTLRQAPHAQGASSTVLASLVEPLLHSPDWVLAVACVPDDVDTILGFALYCTSATRVPTVGWIQVRAPFRRHGIGLALLRHALPTLPPEIHTPFAVQRIGPGQPSLTELALHLGITVRHRPWIPLQVALDLANVPQD